MKIKNVASVLSGHRMKRIISPSKIIEEVGVKNSDTVVDYGAGAGMWTIPLSEAVGRRGKIIALSANKDFKSLIKKKSELLKLGNIETVSFNLEKGKITVSGKADFVVMANVLHIIKDTEGALKRASKLIKKDGQIVVVDYLKLKTMFGPPVHYRLSEEETMNMAGKAGLKFKCLVDAGWHHYGMIFVKK